MRADTTDNSFPRKFTKNVMVQRNTNDNSLGDSQTFVYHWDIELIQILF